MLGLRFPFFFLFRLAGSTRDHLNCLEVGEHGGCGLRRPRHGSRLPHHAVNVVHAVDGVAGSVGLRERIPTVEVVDSPFSAHRSHSLAQGGGGLLGFKGLRSENVLLLRLDNGRVVPAGLRDFSFVG